jgi:hypothetical protein
MVIKKVWLLWLLPILLVGIFWSGQKVFAFSCGGSDAPWNNDEPRFSCHCIDDSVCLSPYTNCSNDRNSYVVIETSRGNCGGACGTTCPDNEDLRPMHCRCIRPADCTALGGQCIFTGWQQPPAGWISKPYHCPYLSDVVCYVPPAKTPPKEQTPQLPSSDNSVTSTANTNTNTPATPTTVNLSVADCCRQIVPQVARGDYGLNHVVQTAINIYECILCLVGALILAMLIAGAIVIMISAGNDTRVALGKRIISAAVVGGIIVFASFLIVNFMVKALGASFKGDVNKVEINSQG